MNSSHLYIPHPCAGLLPGFNRYTTDLLQLDSCHVTQASTVPEAIAEIRSPLIAKAWENALQHHPDTSLKSYIVTGITNGFRIGFNRSQHLHALLAQKYAIRFG